MRANSEPNQSHYRVPVDRQDWPGSGSVDVSPVVTFVAAVFFMIAGGCVSAGFRIYQRDSLRGGEVLSLFLACCALLFVLATAANLSMFGYKFG